MPALTPILPVLIPSILVTMGWIIVLGKRCGMRWRMALLTASFAVFFLSIGIGLARYHQFGINVRLSHDFVVLKQLNEKLINAVSVIELGVAATVLHLLLAACAFKRVGEHRGLKS
jgi:hypothetical protein